MASFPFQHTRTPRAMSQRIVIEFNSSIAIRPDTSHEDNPNLSMLFVVRPLKFDQREEDHGAKKVSAAGITLPRSP